MDEHGILYITGRIKEMLIVGGFNVFPAEVEDALRLSPSVRDAAVVGVEDERLGEIPAAAVVWTDEAVSCSSEADRVKQLIPLARQALAAYKVPRKWFRLDALPLSDEKNVPYRSTVPNACHACGHDVHTTVLLGTGLFLARIAAAGALPGAAASAANAA